MDYDIYGLENRQPNARNRLRKLLMTAGVALTGMLSATAQDYLDEGRTAYGETTDVGYGSRRPRETTGAIAVITPGDFAGNRTGGIPNAALGGVTGLRVRPGAALPNVFGMNFDLRGTGAPLIVLDGVPLQDGANPPDESEIESIVFLKDASAAVYGTRAVNGVALIATRKGGRYKKPVFEYSGHAGVQEMLIGAELMDAVQYLRMYNERDFNNGRLSVPYGEDLIARYADGTLSSTDWLGTTMRKNPVHQNHAFNVGGSTGRFDYFAAAGYRRRDGWLGNDDLFDRRTSLRSNVTARITENLKASVFLSFVNNDCRRITENEMNVILNGVVRAAPVYRAFVDDDRNRPFALPNATNPAALISTDIGGYAFGREKSAGMNLAAEYAPGFIDGLSFAGTYALQYTEDETKTFRRGYALFDNDNRVASGNTLNTVNRMWAGCESRTMRLSAAFDRPFDDGHAFGAMLAWEENDREGDNFTAGRKTAMQTIDQLFAGTGGMTAGQETAAIDPLNDGNTRDGLFRFSNKALIGRMNWAYDGKYMVDLAFRHDGSSRFSPKRRWLFHPSVSLGWNIAEEDFVRNSALNFIDMLKLRISRGRTSNEETSTYRFVSGYDYGVAGSYLFGDDYVTAASHRDAASSTTEREIASITDLGIDACFLNGGLNITADLYARRRRGLHSAGAPENVDGDLNRGVELTLSSAARIGNVGYRVAAGASMSRTRNLKVSESDANDSYDQWRNKSSDRMNGIVWGVNQNGNYRSLDEIFESGIVYDRAGNAWMLPGDFVYGDWNGDGVIDEHDYHPIYTDARHDDGVKPTLNGHLAIGLEWNGFDLNILFRGAAMVRRSFAGPFRGVGDSNYNGFAEFYDRWRRADETNQSKWQEWIPGKYPSAYLGINNRSFLLTASDNPAWNASWIRLRNLEIGYSFTGTLVEKAGIELLRIFVASYNTFTLTSLPAGDPEADGIYSVPASRTFSVGINVKF